MIQLGPTPRNKLFMLSQIYRILTGSTWTSPATSTQRTTSEDEMTACLLEELNVICKKNPKLLVIIDDVWEVGDAEYYAEIFSGCKIVLTTRRKDISSSIDCKHNISIDSMELPEAVQLLTFKTEQLQNLNTTIVDQINELAENLHKWPLLLNLVRGQLNKYCKAMPYSPLAVIKQVTKKLFDNGLTAFDPKQPKRQNAANASIKASLDLLGEDDIGRLNRLVTSMIFGNTVPKQLLMYLWGLNNEKATECCDDLWSIGLISHATLSFDKASIEIHLVITQYVFDNISLNYFFQVSLNYLSDINSQIQYCNHLLSTTEIGLDNNLLGFWIIDILDSSLIPSILHKTPMMMQISATILYNYHRDLFLHFGIQEVEKQTFLRVREKYKTLLSYLNEGKKSKAIAYINEANEKYLQFFMNVLHAFTSTKISPSIRNCFKRLMDTMSSFYLQLAKAYVNMRSDLFALLIVSKTFSMDKIAEIVLTCNDQFDQALVPFFRELSTLTQTLYSTIPELKNNPLISFQTAADLLLPFQSADSNIGFWDYFPTACSYVSQHQNTLSDASCIII